MKDLLLLIVSVGVAFIGIPLIDLSMHWWTKGYSDIFLDLTERGRDE